MSQFPESLRAWREARRFSQLDLATEAEISTRHLSFLENGRAKPSREMIARLGEALQLPLDARNQLLIHASFAARYPSRRWDSDDMAPIRRAIDLMLVHHHPYPGIAVDRLWTVRHMNEAAALLYGQFAMGVGDSLLNLMMSDQMPQVVENWPDVARHASARLRTESITQGGVAELDRVADYLSGFDSSTSQPLGPVVPTILRLESGRLQMFATISQFGTPEDVTLDDFKIELYFPVDEASDSLLRSIASS